MQINKTLLLCFASVYLIWGSTYLAIIYAIDTLPPWTMTSIRFFVAAGIMLVLSKLKKESALSQEVRHISSVSGIFLITANGVVCVVEQWVPSGMVAVIVGAMPIWIMIIGWLGYGHAKPTGQKLVGALIGLAGVFLIAADHLNIQTSTAEKVGMLSLFASSCIWAVGTLMQRKAQGVTSPFLFSTYQMFTGAVTSALLSLVFESPWNLSWSAVSTSSLLALAYLILFGSIVAFSAYAWLSRNVEPHLVSTYALVNPVIAVWLGWLLLNEPVTIQFIGATILVLIGILLLMFKSSTLQKIHMVLRPKS